MRQIFIIGLISITINSYSQNFIEDFKRLYNNYSSSKYLSFDVDVEVFYSKNQEEGEVVGSGKMYKNGQYYYSKFLADEMVVGKDKTVILDHDDRTIYLFKDNPRNNKLSFHIDIGDSVKLYLSKIGFVKKEGVHIVYKTNLGKNYLNYEIYINQKLGFIDKIIMDYPKTPEFDAYTLVINYRNISTKPFNKDIFSIDKYIELKNKKVKPINQFSDYTIVLADD